MKKMLFINKRKKEKLKVNQKLNQPNVKNWQFVRFDCINDLMKDADCESSQLTIVKAYGN